MEEKALVPELRFPEFENLQPYLKFGEVVESNIYGPRFNANDYDENGNVKTIRGTDVSRGGELKYEQVPTAKLDEKTVEHHKLYDGDLVMITTADCGLTGVFREQKIPYISSAYGVRIRLNDRGASQYFKYFFQTRHAKKEVASFIRKATVANLPGSDILKIRLNLPTLPEQQKIADFLSSIDERIQLLQQKKEKLQAYKKGVMQQLFPSVDGHGPQVNGRGPSKDEINPRLRFKQDNGSDFPDWQQKKLGEVGEIKMCKRVFSHQTVEIGEVPFFKIGTIGSSADSFISKELYNKLKSKYSFPSIRETLITCSGTIGKCVQYDGSEAYYQDSNIVWITNNEAKLSNDFLFILLKKHNWNKLNSTTITRLYTSDLKTLKINFPSLPEQRKIADFLSAIDEQIEHVGQQIEKNQLFKKGLLQKMFV